MPRGGHTKRNCLHLNKLRRQTQNKKTNTTNTYLREGKRERGREEGKKGEGGRKGGRRKGQKKGREGVVPSTNLR